MKKNTSAGIYMPARANKANIPVDQSDINFAKQQLNQEGAPLPQMTDEMQKFINQVGPQKKSANPKRINEKKSNEIYSSLPVAYEREDLKLVAYVLSNILPAFGRKRADFNLGDYCRLALKNQLKRDLKSLKKGNKIFHSRRLLSLNWFKNLLPKKG